MRRGLAGFALTITLGLGPGIAEEPKAAEGAAEPPIAVSQIQRSAPVDFQAEVLPILKKNCLACHNKTDQKGDLVLETPDAIREGGKSGPAAVAGKSGESLLLASASHSTKPFMPPKNNKIGAPPLTPDELGLIRIWIDQGATGKVSATSAAIHWRPLPPGVNPIYASAVTPDGRVAACGRANQIFLYNLAAGNLVTRLVDPALDGVADPDGIQSLAFDSRGGLLASGGYRTVKLWRRPQSPRTTSLADAGGAITVIASNADGSRFAAGTVDGTIITWNPADGKASRPLAAHTAAVTGLQLSPDGSTLYSASLDGSIGVWGAVDGFPAGRLNAQAPVHGIVLASKGTQLAAAGGDGLIRVWPLSPSPKSGQAPAASLSGHAKAVTCLAAAAAVETQILSGGEDGTARLWDVVGAKELKQVSHGSPVAAVAIRPDGQAFASAGSDKAAKLWNMADGKMIAELKGDPDARYQAEASKRQADFAGLLAVNAKGLLAAAEKKSQEEAKKAADSKAAFDKLVADQAAEAAKPVAQTKSPADMAKATADAAAAKKKSEDTAAGAATEAKLAADAVVARKATSDEADAIQKSAQSALEAAQKASADAEQPIRTVAFSSDGQEVITAGDDRAVRVWSSKNGAPVDALRGSGGAVAAIASSAGPGLISGSADKAASRWDMKAPWQLERTLGSPSDASLFADRVTAVAFNGDGTLIATGGGEPSRSGELKIWKTADGSLVQAIANAHSDVVFGVEISPDGKQILSGGADKFVKVFDVATGKLVRSFEGHTHHVLGVSWKSDGKVVASAGADNVIKVWSMESGEQLRTIEGFAKQVTSIRFIPFTPNVITSAGDRVVRIHNTDNGQLVRSFGAAADYLYTSCVTSEGRLVLSGSHSSVLQVWDGTNGSAVASYPAP